MNAILFVRVLVNQSKWVYLFDIQHIVHQQVVGQRLCMVSNALIDRDCDSKWSLLKCDGKNGQIWYGIFYMRTSHHVHLKFEFGSKPLLTMQTPDRIARSSSIQMIGERLIGG